MVTFIGVCSDPQSIENAFVTGTQAIMGGTGRVGIEVGGTGRVGIEVSEKVRPQVVCQFPLDRWHCSWCWLVVNLLMQNKCQEAEDFDLVWTSLLWAAELVDPEVKEMNIETSKLPRGSLMHLTRNLACPTHGALQAASICHGQVAQQNYWNYFFYCAAPLFSAFRKQASFFPNIAARAEQKLVI